MVVRQVLLQVHCIHRPTASNRSLPRLLGLLFFTCDVLFRFFRDVFSERFFPLHVFSLRPPPPCFKERQIVFVFLTFFFGGLLLLLMLLSLRFFPLFSLPFFLVFVFARFFPPCSFFFEVVFSQKTKKRQTYHCRTEMEENRRGTEPSAKTSQTVAESRWGKMSGKENIFLAGV